MALRKLGLSILKEFSPKQSYSLLRTCQRARVYTIPNHEDKERTLTKLTLWLSQPIEFYTDEKMLNHQKELQDLHALRNTQKFSHYTDLGDELNAAFFFVSNGGAVKLNSSDKWYRKSASGYHTLPMDNKNDEHFVTGIKLLNMPLLYEGIEYLGRLRSVFFLDVRNNKYFDDFCMSRLYCLSDTLEFLDISGCSRITDRGLQCVHSLKNLKMLRIDNLPSVENKQYIAFLLEELIPNCVILGVEPIQMENDDQQTIEADKLTLNEKAVSDSCEGEIESDISYEQHALLCDDDKEDVVRNKFTLDDILERKAMDEDKKQKQHNS